MKRTTLWFSAMLIAGASVSIFLMVNREQQPNQIQHPGGINRFMQHPIYTDYDQKGQLHSKLNATLMTHYVRHDTYLFNQPKILIYTDNRVPWYITANHGKSQNSIKKVLLFGNVVMYQPPRPHHPETKINTSEITVYRKRSFAETDKAVQIKRPGTLIKGKGVTADLKKGIVTLLKQSQGIYQPQK